MKTYARFTYEKEHDLLQVKAITKITLLVQSQQ